MSDRKVRIKQGVAAIIMAVSGVLLGWSSDLSYGFVIPNDNSPYIIVNVDWNVLPAVTMQKEKKTLKGRKDKPESIAVVIPSVTKLNLSFLFPDNTEERDGQNSYAGQIYAELTDLDAQWTAQIYDMEKKGPEELAAQLGRSVSVVKGLYNPKDELHNQNDPDTWIIHNFTKTEISFIDETGNQLHNISNSKSILSMASVYTFYTGAEDSEAFKDYAKKLWQRSHNFLFDISPVYYCDGSCIFLEDESVKETEANEASVATPSNAESKTRGVEQGEGNIEIEPEYRDGVIRIPSILEFTGPGVERSAEETIQEEELPILCPGHVDLHIEAVVTGMEGLFKTDDKEYRAMSSSAQNRSWNGWNEQNRAYAADLDSQDWEEEYGISTLLPNGLHVLSSDEIAAYMDQLPDSISDERKRLIRCALSSVGRIPYYWGGKPVIHNYEGNQFGALVNPDEKGRILRGLDCSGWIVWVYWTALDKHLPYDGTDGLVNVGAKIDRSDLKPGDIAIRLGETPHVVMFLNWEADGSMRVIHESSSAVNNVTISTGKPDWSNYRRILE